ncbi:MAG: polyprenol monophosphomannose synthase [Candidatus Cloacimonadia bacterium]
MRALVITPTYNEAENIRAIIEKVLEQDARIEMLIVDDNSPDGTGKIVEEIMETEKRVHILKRAGKLGLGSAYIAGFKYAIENGYDAVFEMDGDFSHDPKVLPVMLKEIENNDVIIGSRYVKGVCVLNWPMKRLLLSYFASKYVKFITRMPFKDPTSGFKCYRIEALKNLELDKIMSDGYSFQVEVKYRLWLKKFRIKEIPIVFNDRFIGESKMSKKIVYEAVWMVWKLRFLAILGKL